LVVDDNPKNIKLLSTYLKADGHVALSALSGPEALHLARTSHPDIILLDIMMPGMDGFEVTRELKQDARTSIIPIIMVTALHSTEDRIRGLDTGADEFLSKPVNRTELITRIRSLFKLKLAQDELRNRAELVTRISNQVMDLESPGADNVLLVEDDEMLAKHISTTLTSKGYSMVRAHNGSAALEAIKQFTPNIILLDLLLPDRSGQEMISQFKSDERLREVPILVITALQDLETKVEAIDIGADDYLVKPIESAELVARIRAALRRSKAHEKLKLDVENLYHSAVTDPLTSLHNRLYLESDISKRIALIRRYGHGSFSLAIIDIDLFKQVNDTYGHEAGDRVLTAFAKALRGACRDFDIAARYGGEEFCLVLPETDQLGAYNLCERLRQNLADLRFEEWPELRITASFGISDCREGDAEFIDIFRRADRALYQAKQAGRNRVKASE
jgi:two-component system cell cycle response regulator